MLKTSIKPLLHFSKSFTRFILILVACTGTLFGQHLYPISKNGKSGLIDAQGKVVVSPVHDTCIFSYKSQLSMVKDHDLWSIYNLVGLPISAVAYDSIWYFTDRYLVAQLKDKAYIIETDRQQLTQLEEVDTVALYKEGEQTFLKLWKQGSVFLFNVDGKKFFERLSLSAFTKVDNKYYLVQKQGKYGIITRKGTPYLDIKYDSIFHFYGGLKYTLGEKEGFKKTHFYLDSPKGDHHITTFPAVYHSISTFGTHYLRLTKGKETILFHIKDQKTITRDFNKNARPFTEHYHQYKVNRKYGLCDLKGNELTKPLYNKLLDSEHKDVVIYQKDKKYGFMDSKGKELTENLYDFIAPFKVNGLLPRPFTKYKIRKRFGLINISGDTLSAPLYANIKLISDNKAICTFPDTSVTVFILDPETGALDDYYNLAHIKLLKVDKYYTHTGYDNLTHKITPQYGHYFSHKVIQQNKKEDYQYSTDDFSFVKMKKEKRNTLFFQYSLLTETFSPIDQSISILSFYYEDKKNSFSYDLKEDFGKYKTAQTVDNQFIRVVNFENKTRYLNNRLTPFKLSYLDKKQKRTAPVVDFYKASDIFPRVFKVKHTRNKFSYLVPTRSYKHYFTKPLCDTLLFNDSTIFGRRDNYWQAVLVDTKDSILPRTVDISFSDQFILGKQERGASYIYDERGNEITHLDSITIINQSNRGYILIKQDSLYNYLNPKGELILKEWTTEGTAFVNGFASIKVGENYSVINRTGEQVFLDRRRPLVFNPQGVTIYTHKRKKGLMDTTGAIVDSAKYAVLKPIKYTSLFSYKTNKTDALGILTSKGEQLFSDHFSNIKKHDSSSVLVYTKKGIGLLDCETKTIIIPTKFNKIKNGAPGYHLIMKNNKWGVYSPKNEAILKPKYTSISYSKRNTVTTIKSKKATSYLLKDGSISELKPETLYAIKTTDSLDLNHDGDYVGFQKIPTRYHTIEKLKNGCYLARRKHVFNLCSYTGETFLKSDTWTAAKILDNQIMQVQTASSKVKYYNLQQMKWVYQNPEE